MDRRNFLAAAGAAGIVAALPKSLVILPKDEVGVFTGINSPKPPSFATEAVREAAISDKWHRYAVTRINGMTRAYLDGVEVAWDANDDLSIAQEGVFDMLECNLDMSVRSDDSICEVHAKITDDNQHFDNMIMKGESPGYLTTRNGHRVPVGGAVDGLGVPSQRETMLPRSPRPLQTTRLRS